MRLAGAAALAAAMTLGGCALTPRNDRDWMPYLANTATVDRAAPDRVVIRPVTDWRYDAKGPVSQEMTEVAFDPADLQRVWFVLEPQPGSTVAAHTFLLFEFKGDRLLGLTIEARREADEKYSAVRGAFNAFELSYLWGTARDLLVRRALYLDHDVYVYPIAIDAEQRAFLLRRVLDRTQRLTERPRFYNTLGANCTNELAKAAKLRWNPAFIATGWSDEFLFREKIIPGSDLSAVRARADMKTAIRTHANAEAFDAAVLADLRQRFPETRP